MAMDSQFYRNLKKPRWWKEQTRQVVSQPKRALIIIGAILLGFFVLLNNKGVIARVQLELERREVQEKVRQAEEETKQLQAQLKALEGDKKTIEKIARERYGMAREGETIYRVTPQQ
ncbi:MAG TPA: septum formation initiator family protein [Bacteroidota bacterium]|nr:septum formation initiator family protein [Bacteroidota bacterium]